MKSWGSSSGSWPLTGIANTTNHLVQAPSASRLLSRAQLLPIRPLPGSPVLAAVTSCLELQVPTNTKATASASQLPRCFMIFRLGICCFLYLKWQTQGSRLNFRITSSLLPLIFALSQLYHHTVSMYFNDLSSLLDCATCGQVPQL